MIYDSRLKKLLSDVYYHQDEINLYNFYTLIISKENHIQIINFLKKYLDTANIKISSSNYKNILKKDNLLKYSNYKNILIWKFEKLTQKELFNFFLDLYKHQKEINYFLQINFLNLIFLMDLETFEKIKKFHIENKMDNNLYLKNSFWEEDY